MLPFTSLARALCETGAKLLWVSVSSIRDPERFVEEFSRLSDIAIDQDAALIVGGKALTEDVRMKMKYTAFCDQFTHLDTISRQTLGLLRKNNSQ